MINKNKSEFVSSTAPTAIHQLRGSDLLKMYLETVIQLQELIMCRFITLRNTLRGLINHS
jgi:hypothetical protein